MEQPIENSTPKKRGRKDATPDPNQPSFADGIAAAEAEAGPAEPEWTWDVSEEVIDVKITDADCRAMIQANGADEDAKAAADREIDALKAELKEKRAESEALATRIRDRNRQGSKETWPKKAHWKIGTCFSLNTVVYVDPDTGEEVARRALTQSERQLELGVDAALDALKPTAEVEPAPPASTDMTDPEKLLEAAQRGDALDPAAETLDNEPSFSALTDEDDEDDAEDES